MKNNQPAFPTWLNNSDVAQGMTLRDFFATAAMQGFSANQDMGEISVGRIAEWAYTVADEMLKARQK